MSESSEDLEHRFRTLAIHGNAEAMESLIASGSVDINAMDIYNGWSALHYACAGGHFEAVKLLLKEGAETDFPNDHGQIPIDLAHKSEIKALLPKPYKFHTTGVRLISLIEAKAVTLAEAEKSGIQTIIVYRNNYNPTNLIGHVLINPSIVTVWQLRGQLQREIDYIPENCPFSIAWVSGEHAIPINKKQDVLRIQDVFGFPPYSIVVILSHD